MSIQTEIDRINGNIAATYDTLSTMGAEMPAQQNSDNLAATASGVAAVLYIQQALTEEQQAQARENIGAASSSGSSGTPSAHASTHATGGSDPITPESIGAAQQPIFRSVTLSASGWDSSAKTQTITVSGILADETKQLITPTPALASQTAYYEAVVLCTGQAADQLTFTAKKIPTDDLTVYVTIQEVGA